VPLPVKEDREHIHTRTIAINAYRLKDGMMDVEGRITDVKPFDHQMMDSFRKKGEPVHDLSIRITLDDDLKVVAAVASMDQGAHDLCPRAEPNFKNIVGLQIGPGWNKKVKAAMSPGLGCTHIIEMLAQMASGAMQANWSRRAGEKHDMPDPKDREMSFGMINSCYPYRENSPWIKENFPRHYKASE
jgi:DUF2889 family protein